MLKQIINKLIGPVAALVLTLIVGSVFIIAIGKDPFLIYNKLFLESFSTSYGIGQILFKATPLIFTGLSVAFAFKAGLFNIGAEGQLSIGAFLTAWAGFTFTSLPGFILIPLCILAGFLGGALWGYIAGYLKARFGSHEVINTIMLNFIALALVNYLVNNVYFVPATVRTPQIAPQAELSTFSEITGLFKGSPFNISIFLALFCCVLFFAVFKFTKFGYSLRVLGANRFAAEYAKMNISRLTIYTMLIAGGLAGLVGSNFVLGYKNYFELGFSEGIGYIGIAVALMARNNPAGIILAAVFFGIIEYGGLTINTLVPKELVTMLQAIIIIFVIVFTKLFDKVKILKTAL